MAIAIRPIKLNFMRFLRACRVPLVTKPRTQGNVSGESTEILRLL